MFCGKCGTQVPDDNKFCSNCGSPMGDTAPSQATTEVPQNTNQEKDKEKVYYKGEGELLVRTTKHHGAGRKAASFIVGMGVGYLVAGRDSKRTSKAKGTIVVTNRAIYCAGNDYPFDKIMAFSVKGTLQKKIHLTLDKDMAAGKGKGVGGSDRISVEIEIATKDIDGLFKGLEQAKMGNLDF